MISFSKLVAVRSQLHNVVGNRFILHGLSSQPPQHQQSAGLKTVEERIGVPLRPKRPLVPFMRFYKDIRPTLVEANPAQKMGILAQLAAAKWKQADQLTKDKYNEDFRKDQESFLKEIARYQNTLTDEQREKVKQMKLLISEKRKSREKRQKARELGKPKHPVPAFTQYLTEQTTKVDKTKVVFREFAVKMGENWRAMTEAEKAPYMDKYKVDMAAYKKEIQKWEEKMIKSGNRDLVRRKSLMDTNTPTTGTSAAAKKKTVSTPATATAAAPAKSTRVPAARLRRTITSSSATSQAVIESVEPTLPLVDGNKGAGPNTDNINITSSDDKPIKVADAVDQEQSKESKETKSKARKFFKFF